MEKQRKWAEQLQSSTLFWSYLGAAFCYPRAKIGAFYLKPLLALAACMIVIIQSTVRRFMVPILFTLMTMQLLVSHQHHNGYNHIGHK